MRRRCTDTTNNRYKQYGGRGIKICERWNDFYAFLSDMGPRPSPRHSIERNDNNGNYEPNNCRWATMKEQCRNRTTSRIVEFRGYSMSLAEAADIAGLPYTVVRARFYRLKWPLEECLTRPTRSEACL